MLGKLFLTFTLVTLVELGLLIELGKVMGMWPTVGLVMLTGFWGAWLAKDQGVRTLARAREELNRGAIPADAVMDGILILFSGAFLVTPGILTDVCGFGLLLPPCRRPIKAWAKLRMDKWIAKGTVRVHNFSGPRGFPGTGPSPGQPGVGVWPNSTRRADAVDITPEAGSDQEHS